ncbi:hypothetical protein D3C81_1005990 [compost metagenome]
MEAGHADYRTLQWAYIPADNGLECCNDMGSCQNRIVPVLRHCGMRSEPLHLYDESIGPCHEWAWSYPNCTYRQIWLIMHTEDRADPIKRTALQHNFSPFGFLLRRLEDEADPSGKLSLLLLEQIGRSKYRCCMEIMSAGMHPARDPGSELKPGLLLNR